MRTWWLLAVLTFAPFHAGAQQPDCGSPPPGGSSLPVAIDLAGQPGVPKGVSGQVYLQVPMEPPATQDCGTQPPPPRDVLAGEPGDVLRGPPSPNLLRGPGAPRVEIETLPPAR